MNCGKLVQLGAMCHVKVSDAITHVVSTAQDTDKMHWARRHHRHRVSVNWLYVSGIAGSRMLHSNSTCLHMHQLGANWIVDARLSIRKCVYI